MTDKEKVQAYDEALERARKILDKILDNELPGFPDQIRGIFPELKESEDERIIQAIYEAIKDAHINTLKEYGSSCKEALDWLKTQFEKQKEQKPEEINLKALLTSDRLASAEMTGRLKERSEILENPEKYGLRKSAAWSEEDIEMYINIESSLRAYAFGLKNEEHKRRIKKELDWLENRFKTINPDSKESLQSHWKPSEEQMWALDVALENFYNQNDRAALESLYNDLKKL